MTSTFALAATGALADMNFTRMASFVTYSNNAAAMAESSAEIISASGEGIKLVYTDSPLGVIGMIDITDPSAPKALGNIDVGGEPTTVSALGALPTWVLSQSLRGWSDWLASGRCAFLFLKASA